MNRSENSKPTKQPPQLPPTLTDDTLLRLSQVLQLVPVARSTWWDGVKEGRYPKPVRIGARAVAWRVRDLRALIASTDYQARTAA
jgi:predicted DNA-binding transcriptional regulator AlpA